MDIGVNGIFQGLLNLHSLYIAGYPSVSLPEFHFAYPLIILRTLQDPLKEWSFFTDSCEVFKTPFMQAQVLLDPYVPEAVSYLLFYMIIRVSSVCLCTTQHLLRPAIDNNTVLWPFLQNPGPGIWESGLLWMMQSHCLQSSLTPFAKTLWGLRARLPVLISKYPLLSSHAVLSHQYLGPLFWYRCLP